jgi:hypothetical protein
MISSALFSSETDEWETPLWLFRNLKSGYNKGRQMGDYPGPTLPGRRYDIRLLQAAMDRLSGIQGNDGSTPLEQWRATRARSATGH